MTFEGGLQGFDKEFLQQEKKIMLEKLCIAHRFSIGKISKLFISGGGGGILALTKSSTPPPPAQV